ncbi:cytochrome P450 monooxygenase [Fusarium napiforme]|uniref:Cytochrome P450 monooxygenase n=1 Tax=Fusarium napiforme TaxID=42672 RepID=A0A8H5J4V1_9HYPO|nr:cytochrome P450 monooxygenase [Fusarium napiforme]
MRFSILFAVGLATDVALASVCKPRPSVSSTSTTTVEAESTTATSADLSTTLTSSVDDETTTAATEMATTTETSVTVGSSTTVLETTGTAETTMEIATTDTATTDATTTDEATTTDGATTTAMATSAETTTAVATTTTADTFVPVPTFNVLAIGAQLDGQKVGGEVETGYEIGWNLEGAPQTLAFSIDPDTNQVIEISGYYLCVRYTDKDVHPLTLCDPGTENNFMAGGLITSGFGLAMGREGNSPNANTQPVDLGIEAASDDS